MKELLKLLFKVLLAGCVVSYLIYFWTINHNYFEYNKSKRLEYADSSPSIIEVAVVWTLRFGNSFVEGVQLAAEELNSGKGVMGKKIQLHIYDEPIFMNTNNIPREIAENHHIVAVIGHATSGQAIPASVTYEYNGVLFLASVSTSPSLTMHAFNLVLRNIPSDKDFVNQLVKLCIESGWKRILIIHEREMHGISVSEVFQQIAKENYLEIALCRSYSTKESNFYAEIARAREYNFDAILLAGLLPTSGILVKQLREMGVTQPILGTDAIDSSQLMEVAGDAANNVYVTGVFHHQIDNEGIQKFNRKFSSRYGRQADSDAAQGYESLSILAQAYERCQSIDPIIASTTLKFSGKYQGISSEISFTVNGDALGKNIVIKKVKNGKFEFFKID